MTLPRPTTAPVRGVDELIEEVAEADGPFVEILRGDSTSVCLYCLEAGDVGPHHDRRQNEVYYTILGSGTVAIEDGVREIEAGDVVSVAAGRGLRFSDVDDLLVTLVFSWPTSTG